MWVCSVERLKARGTLRESRDTYMGMPRVKMWSLVSFFEKPPFMRWT